MTSQRECQIQFAQKYESVLVFACMEYITRVTPAYMPVEYSFLKEMGVMNCFFERVPLMCDEFRQHIEENRIYDWKTINALAASYVEKITRLKRRHKVQRGDSHHSALGSREIRECMEMPVFGGLDPLEYKLASYTLGIAPEVLSNAQHLLVVRPLPANLGAIQCRGLLQCFQSNPGTTARQLYMQTRMHVCLSCMSQKSSMGKVFRLDTLTQELICASCFSNQTISVDLLGRSVQSKSHTYYVCPGCLSVQTYQGNEAMWSSRKCLHLQKDKIDNKRLPKIVCCACDEYATQVKWERVNFLTGKLELIQCCQKHSPSWEESKYCTNTQQIGNLAKLKNQS